MEQDLDTFRALKVPSTSAGGRGARRNIMGDQGRALAALRSSDNIIIKHADKGGQIVLHDRINYLFEANSQSQPNSNSNPNTKPNHNSTCTPTRIPIPYL